VSKLELTEKEAVAQIEILTSFLSDLKTERAGTGTEATDFFRIPPERAVELGIRIEI